MNVESQNEKAERGKAMRQIVASFIANIGTINTGLIFGFSAVGKNICDGIFLNRQLNFFYEFHPVIPQLRLATSDISIDDSQASWIGE